MSEFIVCAIYEWSCTVYKERLLTRLVLRVPIHVAITLPVETGELEDTTIMYAYNRTCQTMANVDLLFVFIHMHHKSQLTHVCIENGTILHLTFNSQMLH